MPALIGETNSREMVEAVEKEMNERRVKIKKLMDYYVGKHSRPMKRKEMNVIINLCRQVVDETVAFLMPDMPVIQLDEDAETDAEEYARMAWAMSGGARLLAQVATSGGISGHVFTRVIPPMDNQSLPKLVNIPPQNIVRFYDADDMSILEGYELRWGDNRQVIRRNPDNAGWLVDEYAKDAGMQWKLLDTLEWAYPIPPVIDWQHLPSVNDAYGMTEIPHYELNDAVNKVASDMQAILRYHAYPTTVGTGFSAKDVQTTSIDGFLAIADKDASVFNVEMESDLSSSFNMLKELQAVFYRLARVVVVTDGLNAFRGVTNLSIRAAFEPMIAKNETLRRNYGEGIAIITRLVLMLGGYDVTIDTPVMVEWGDALPMDARETWQMLDAQMARGLVSKRTVNEELGRDHDREMARIEQETLFDDMIINGNTGGV